MYRLFARVVKEPTLEERICSNNILEFNGDENIQVVLLVVTLAILFTIFAFYLRYSAKKMAYRFSIPKTKINYTTLDGQFFSVITATIGVCFKKIVLQLSLIFDDPFLIVWIYDLLIRFLLPFSIETYTLVNLFKMPEYNGFVAISYPGQESP